MPSQATYLCSAMVAKEPDSSDKAEMSSRSSIFSYAELQLHPPLGWSKNSVAAAVPAASSQRQAFHSDLWGFPFSALGLRQRTGNECFVPTLRHGFLIREIRVIRSPLQRFLKFFRIFEARFPEEVSERWTNNPIKTSSGSRQQRPSSNPNLNSARWRARAPRETAEPCFLIFSCDNSEKRAPA